MTTPEKGEGRCRVCLGGGWVCEDHSDHAWAGTADVEECCGGAGAPCGACNPEMASAGYVHAERTAIVAWLREHSQAEAVRYHASVDHDVQVEAVTLNEAYMALATAIESGAHHLNQGKE